MQATEAQRNSETAWVMLPPIRGWDTGKQKNWKPALRITEEYPDAQDQSSRDHETHITARAQM